MRAGLCFLGSDAPKSAESRVGKTHAAIRSEHRYPFRKVIDCLSLHLDQRVVTGFEIHLFGQVFKDPGCATLRMCRCNDAQSLPAWQMPGVGLGIDGLVDSERCIFPGAPVELLRQPSAAAERVEEFPIIRT